MGEYDILKSNVEILEASDGEVANMNSFFEALRWLTQNQDFVIFLPKEMMYLWNVEQFVSLGIL